MAMPIQFSDSTWIGKPKDMEDEQCSGIYASNGVVPAKKICFHGAPAFEGNDQENFHYFATLWKFNREEMEALNNGGAFFIKSLSLGLVPMAIIVIDAEGKEV